MIVVAMALGVVVLGVVVFTLWGQGWGATDAELTMPMVGDTFLDGSDATKVVMTRGVTIDATSDEVWPWLAQLGRGGGWYSYDFLDNGSKESARHIVSWVPPPERGDATAIGYLRHVKEGSELSWWTPGLDFLGSFARLAFDVRLAPLGERSRLVIRMSADAAGGAPVLALNVFRFLDSVMARRELLGIKERVEQSRERGAHSESLETGARGQYQLCEVIYASGERAGAKGKEHAERWRRAAIADGVLAESESLRCRSSPATQNG